MLLKGYTLAWFKELSGRQLTLDMYVRGAKPADLKSWDQTFDLTRAQLRKFEQVKLHDLFPLAALIDPKKTNRLKRLRHGIAVPFVMVAEKRRSLSGKDENSDLTLQGEVYYTNHYPDKGALVKVEFTKSAMDPKVWDALIPSGFDSEAPLCSAGALLGVNNVYEIAPLHYKVKPTAAELTIF